MSRNELEYYRARALAEREAAEAASEPHVAAIHRELAEHYEAIVRLNGQWESSRPSGAGREPTSKAQTNGADLSGLRSHSPNGLGRPTE